MSSCLGKYVAAANQSPRACLDAPLAEAFLKAFCHVSPNLIRAANRIDGSFASLASFLSEEVFDTLAKTIFKDISFSARRDNFGQKHGTLQLPCGSLCNDVVSCSHCDLRKFSRINEHFFDLGQFTLDLLFHEGDFLEQN